MDSIEIGDIQLTDMGNRVRLTVAESWDSATWTASGASLAVGWLLGWIARQAASRPVGEDRGARYDQAVQTFLEELRA